MARVRTATLTAAHPPLHTTAFPIAPPTPAPAQARSADGRQRLLEQRRDPRLLRRRLERLDHLAVCRPEARGVVVHPVLLAHRLHLGHERAELVPWHPGPQVVNHLELQPAVEPVEPRGAAHVHRPVELHAHPVSLGRAVERGPGKVRDADLHVDHARDGVREEEEDGALRARGQGRVEGSDPRKVQRHSRELRPAPPDVLLRRQQDEALYVEVDARDGHDEVEGVVLVAHQEPGEAVELEDAVVVQRRHPGEVLVRYGEQGDVLDVRIALDAVHRHVVHVVRRLPPRDADAVEGVAHHEPDQAVVQRVVRHRVVPRVVPDEQALLPEETQEDRAQHVDPGGLAREHAVQRRAQQGRQARCEVRVVTVVRGVKRLVALDHLSEVLH
mmetsp:Transcript_10415/g.36265  ORF Transcript_10415/g.36265 Transcript_10415/m.36265 type:complete len:386 (+) Transcript_10415:872-2029(+)